MPTAYPGVTVATASDGMRERHFPPSSRNKVVGRRTVSSLVTHRTPAVVNFQLGGFTVRFTRGHIGLDNEIGCVTQLIATYNTRKTVKYTVQWAGVQSACGIYLNCECTECTRMHRNAHAVHI